VAKPFLNKPQIFMVEISESLVPNDLSSKFAIICYSIDWNGSKFDKVPFEMTIERFSDKKSLFELPFYPLDFHQDMDDDDDEPKSRNCADDSPAVKRLKAKLKDRGVLYKKYCTAKKGKQTFRYNGTAYHQKGSSLFYSSSRYADEDALSYSTDSSGVVSSQEYSPLHLQVCFKLEKFRIRLI